VVDGTTTKIVDYLDGFQTEERGSRIPVGAIATQLSNNEQYAGEVLQFFPRCRAINEVYRVVINIYFKFSYLY
jgi:hypothetical protein